VNFSEIRRLQDFRKVSRVEQAAILIPLAVQARVGAVYLWKKYKIRKIKGTCSIKIDRSSWFCPVAADWAASFSEQEIKTVEADSSEQWDEDAAEYKKNLIFMFADKATFEFQLQGHKIKASFESPTEGDSDAPAVGSGNVLKELASAYASKAYLYFHCDSLEGLDVLRKELYALHEKRSWSRLQESTKVNRFYVFTKNGWRSSDREKRPLHSVVLKAGLLESLTEDLQKFLDDKGKYFDLGIPWRRGYLFYGLPGTGKSSIIKALASHFNRDLYFLSLKDIPSDSELISAVQDVRRNGILLIEDVDVFRAAQERKEGDEEDGLTLSGLLNVLDGPATPDGLITFMSTNYRDRLDSALVREGRVDFQAEIGLPDLEQISRLWNVFYPEAPFNLTKIPADKSTAFFSDIFKTHMDDPQAAENALKEATK
jgi:hypothetical protein